MWRAVFVSQMKCDVCGYEDFRNLITWVEKKRNWLQIHQENTKFFPQSYLEKTS